MAKKKSFKFLKWVGIVLLSLILVGTVYLYFFFLPQLKTALEDRLNSDFAGAYELTIGKLSVDPSEKKIEFYNVNLAANPAFFDTNTTHPFAFNVAIDHFKMNLGNVIALSEGKAIDIDEFLLENPTINLAQRVVEVKEEAVSAQNDATVNSLMQSIQIGDFNIVNANIFIEENLFDTHYIAKSEDIDISINSFSFKSGETYVIDYNYVSFSMEELYFPLNDVMEAKIANVEFDTRKDTQFRISDFRLRPTADVQTYTDFFGNRTPYLHILVESAKVTAVDFDQLMDEGKLHIERIDLINPSVELLANSNLIALDSHAVKPMLNTVFVKVNAPYQIDTLQLSSLEFKGEIVPEGFKGVIPIQVLDATVLVTHLNNTEPTIPVTIDVTGDLMHAHSPLALRYTLDKDTVKYGWHVDLNVNSINLVDFNQALSTTNFNIKSGEIDHFKAQISGNNYKSYGRVQFETSNIRLAQNSQEDRGMLGKAKDGVVVFGGNTFLSFKAPKHGKVYVGNINFNRQVFRSPLHMIVGGIGDGVKDALGGDD